MRVVFFFCILLMMGTRLLAQDPTVKIQRDTIVLEATDTALIASYAKRYNPRKALLYAAVVPGLGQIYNKKYWKLPLVYGGFYAFGYAINHYNEINRKYKQHLYYNLENNTDPNPDTNLTTAQLRRIEERSRRERDLMVICMGGMYILQMIDAHVDAHLKEFDLNPNLRVSVEPRVTSDVLTGRLTGMSLVMRF